MIEDPFKVSHSLGSVVFPQVECYVVISKKRAVLKVVDLSSPKVEAYRVAKRLGFVDGGCALHLHEGQLAMLQGRQITHLAYNGVPGDKKDITVDVAAITTMNDDDYELFTEQLLAAKEQKKAGEVTEQRERVVTTSRGPSLSAQDLERVYQAGICAIIKAVLKAWSDNQKAIEAAKKEEYNKRIAQEKELTGRRIQEEHLKYDRLKSEIVKGCHCCQGLTPS